MRSGGRPRETETRSAEHRGPSVPGDRNAPPPRVAHHRQPCAGLDARPSTISPSSSSDQRAPRRLPCSEEPRPVDAVDDPSSSRRAGRLAHLFPHEAVAGEAPRTASRIASSAATSAAVTGLPSGFLVDVTPSGLHHRRVTSSARSASANATATSDCDVVMPCRNSARRPTVGGRRFGPVPQPLRAARDVARLRPWHS